MAQSSNKLKGCWSIQLLHCQQTGAVRNWNAFSTPIHLMTTDKNQALLKEGWALGETGGVRKGQLQKTALTLEDLKSQGFVAKNHRERKKESTYSLKTDVKRRLLGYPLTGVTGSQWDSSHGWIVAKDEYKLFRKSMPGRWGIWMTYKSIQGAGCKTHDFALNKSQVSPDMDSHGWGSENSPTSTTLY